MNRIECDCKICKNNNGGQPLAALIPDALYKKLRGDFHGTVYSANDPSVLGAAVRNATGIQAG